MKHQTFTFDLLTPLLSGGTRPAAQAEIRGPAIRGQLRWWFRVLGGFRSLAATPLAAQEQQIFGAARPGERRSSALRIQLDTAGPSALSSRTAIGADDLQGLAGADSEYLFFTLRQNRRAGFGLANGPAQFRMDLIWTGEERLWEDVLALVAVFGQWGALGYRSRRALGALGMAGNPPSLAAALARFRTPDMVVARQLPARDRADAVRKLARWLKGWRYHGRSQDVVAGRCGPGFTWVRQDHDAGLRMHGGPVFRAALGLPIHQRYTQGQLADWTWQPGRTQAEQGRFASPVILRPYRSPSGQWAGLILFIDAQRWPAGRKAYLQGRPVPVSLELYDAMKQDESLRPAL